MTGQEHDRVAVANQFQHGRYVFVSSLLSRDMCMQLARSIDHLPCRRVTVGDHPETWDELRTDFHDELTATFRTNPVLGLVLAALGRGGRKVADDHVTCWVNRYRVGEYIPRHTDASGTAQVVLCLQAPDESNGGVLMLATDTGELGYVLTPGDAVLFHPTAVEHWTTPLIPSPTEPEPVRVVAVGRYYL